MAMPPTARRTLLTGAVAGVALLGSIPASADAGTIPVQNLNDLGPGSLRQAIADAVAGDTIVVPSGTIALTSGNLAVNKNLEIAGAGSGGTTISGSDTSRVFDITGAPMVALRGLKITHGKAQFGAGIQMTGTLTLTGVAVTENHAGGAGTSGFGAGIRASGATTLNLVDSVVSGNTAGGGVGGSGFGGGIGAEPTANGQAITINATRSRITGNVAGGADSGFGAGIDASTGFDNGSVNINVADSTVGANRAGGPEDGFGGGIDTGSGGNTNTITVSVDRSAITGNISGGGGGSGYGGGISHSSGGSGVTSILNVSNSTISGNRAGGGGTSTGYGAGIDFSGGFSGGTVRGSVLNSTIAGNASASGAGIDSSTLTVRNSIVAGNAPKNCSTPLASDGHNIEDAATCGFSGAGDHSGTNPLLSALGDYGGPTQTQVPLAGSPAINGADSAAPPVDQRGVARPQAGGYDVGSVELTPPTVTTGTASSVGPSSAVLGGTVNPNASQASTYFQFGRTTAYSSAHATPRSVSPTQILPVGISGREVSAKVTGLRPRTLYHYRLVAANAVATGAGADRTFLTQPPIPRISGFRVVPSRFKVAKARTPVSARKRRAARRGTSFRFRLSNLATVRITIQRPRSGRRVGKRCRAPSRKLRKRRRCTRFVRVGTLKRKSIKPGKRKIRFSGRIGRRKLRPGRYRATITAKVAGQPRPSAPRRANLRVLRG